MTPRPRALWARHLPWVSLVALLGLSVAAVLGLRAVLHQPTPVPGADLAALIARSLTPDADRPAAPEALAVLADKIRAARILSDGRSGAAVLACDYADALAQLKSLANADQPAAAEVLALASLWADDPPPAADARPHFRYSWDDPAAGARAERLQLAQSRACAELKRISAELARLVFAGNAAPTPSPISATITPSARWDDPSTLTVTNTSGRTMPAGLVDLIVDGPSDDAHALFRTSRLEAGASVNAALPIWLGNDDLRHARRLSIRALSGPDRFSPLDLPTPALTPPPMTIK